MQLYVDECCSTKLAKELRDFYLSDYPGLVIRHVLDHYQRGTGDSVWLGELESNRNWIVITSDRGKNPKKEKLPVICSKLGVTHVLISPTLINGGYTLQKTAIVSVWTKLKELHRLPKGTSVRLGMVHRRSGETDFELRVAGRPVMLVLNEMEPS